MKDRVVFLGVQGELVPGNPIPEKGEIYTVKSRQIINMKGYLELWEFVGIGFLERCFRPIDPVYGELVTDTIIEQIEYEKAIEV